MADKEYLQLFKSSAVEVMDKCHVIACGTTRQLADNVLVDNYHMMSFSFDHLKRAEQYFKAVHGDLFKEDELKMMVPKTKKAPIVFVYRYGDENQIFAIAPRYNVDDLQSQQFSENGMQK